MPLSRVLSRLLHLLCLPSTSTLNPSYNHIVTFTVRTLTLTYPTKHNEFNKLLQKKCFLQRLSTPTKWRIALRTRHHARHHYLSAPETCNLKSSTSQCLRLSRNNQQLHSAHSNPTQLCKRAMQLQRDEGTCSSSGCKITAKIRNGSHEANRYVLEHDTLEKPTIHR